MALDGRLRRPQVGSQGAMPEMHEDHGHSPAHWAGVIISTLGFLVGGVALAFGVLPLVIIGGALQIVAVVVAVSMNARGYGAPDLWGELKQKAAAERS